MAERSPFSQTVIAVIWDFDRTLSPHYMQRPLFEAYEVDEDAFWDEVNALPAYYAKAGVNVHKDTCYLGHLLSYVRAGRMPGLTNARLRELGAGIEFFPGVPGVFARLSEAVRGPDFEVGDLRVEVEHYVVSTGLKELILGSAAAPYLQGVWASEFIEEPAQPGYDRDGQPGSGEIGHIAGLLDNTTKTRALFEINKGVNKSASISVNDAIAEANRRVPFSNMVYIADGPSDIPSFSVVNKHGGYTLAVYDPADGRQFEQASRLHEMGRVQALAPADYQRDSHADRVLRRAVLRMAGAIVAEREDTLRRQVGPGPTHRDETRG